MSNSKFRRFAYPLVAADPEIQYARIVLIAIVSIRIVGAIVQAW